MLRGSGSAEKIVKSAFVSNGVRMTDETRKMVWQRMASELFANGFDVVRVREIRDWFWEIDDSDLGWEEFGEALHAATMGDALGFRLWVAWVKARHPHVSDLAHQLVLWRSFGRPEEPETLELVVVGATDFKTS